MLRRAANLALLSCLALSTSGCAVMMTQEGHEGGSGSLSEAAAQAGADSTRRTRKPPPDVGYTVPPQLDVGLEAGVEGEAEAVPLAPVETPPAPRTHRVFASLVCGGGALGGQDYDGFSTWGLCVGAYPEPRTRVDVAVTYDALNFTNQGAFGQAFKNPEEFSLDLTVRYYLTRDQTFMGLYPLAGLGTGTLFWDYASPVTVIVDGGPKQLTEDQINYFSFFAGAGMSLIQTRHLHVGGNLSGGVRFYGHHTGSNLENDMLETTGYFKVLIELSLRVAKV